MFVRRERERRKEKGWSAKNRRFGGAGQEEEEKKGNIKWDPGWKKGWDFACKGTEALIRNKGNIKISSLFLFLFLFFFLYHPAL